MLLNRKIMLLIACVCVFFCIISMQDTYAKYTSAISETTDISIARWRILVNDFDIRNNSSTTNLITPHFAGDANIAAGVIAPTATGDMTIIVDATGTDLAFNYTITITNHEDSPVTDIKVDSATLNGQPINVNNGVISGTIGLNDQRSNTFIVYFTWNDGVGSTMSNADDTATTMLQESVAKVSVVANFTQVGSGAGEASSETSSEVSPETSSETSPEVNEP